MNLPDDTGKRHALYRNLERECAGDRDQRRARHMRYRNLMLLGTDTARMARYNKLKEWVQTSSSFLYSAESVRFGATLPRRYGDAFLAELEAVGEEMHGIWHDTDAGLTFGQAVTWSHADDTSVIKVITEDDEPRLELVPDPSDVGVWTPQFTEWARQEVLCHWFYVTLPMFERYLDGISNREYRNALWAAAKEHAGPRDTSMGDALPDSIQSLLIAQSSPTMIGSIAGGINGLPNFSLCRPDVRADLVEIAELWVLDNQVEKSPDGRWRGDYRKVWLFKPTDMVMWEADNPLVPGEHPFHGLTLDPVPGYIWGRCPMELVLRLQDWRETRMDQIDGTLELQLRPPLLFRGWAGDMTELRKRFWQVNGAIGAPPGVDARIENLAPAMPPDAFAEIKELDRMFAAIGGLPLASQGQGEPGVRSGDQAQLYAMLGAGPTADRAMLVERCAENVATQMLRLRRRMYPHALKSRKGEAPEVGEFLLAQLPADLAVKVSAHSASPLFGQQIKQLAIVALDKGAIDHEDFINLLDLPGKEILIPKARRRAAAQAEMKKRALAMKEQEAAAKEKTAQARLEKAK